jgi:agmatine deiminase
LSATEDTTRSSTPRADGFAMPPEFARHERTLMAWPARASLWGSTLEQAKADYAATANAIAAFEPVTMVVWPGARDEARRALAGEVDVLELPIDDSWLRDSGPIFLVDRDGRQRAASVFRFNAWGERFEPYADDARVGLRLCEHLGVPAYDAGMVLEGGSVIVDGAGTALTTEQCLLNPNRNPDLSRDEIEARLKDFLGVERVVWLGQGLVEDRDTDGHIDLIAAFRGPGQVLVQMVDEANPNYVNCLDNVRRLEAAGLDVMTVDWLPYDVVSGEQVAASYMNLYICNDAVIVPVAGSEWDEVATGRIAEAFPDREVVPVPGAVLAYGGGGPHCITQQVPAT